MAARFSRSMQTQASAPSNQLKYVGAAAAAVATAGGFFYWNNQQEAVCEPTPAPTPAPVPAPAPAVADDADFNPKVRNSAFVFIKPHAVTDKTKECVAKGLAQNGLRIVKEGTITAEEIDQGMLIDQHYYAIASKATILKPAQLNVPAEKFKAAFGLGWQEALDKGVVFNAKDACEELGVDAEGLNELWKTAKKTKFGGGFYCGLVSAPGRDPIYVFNAFFMSMRSAFVKPGTSIYYYSVEWDASKLSWEDFRGKVLGPTNPEDAPSGSLRGIICNDWRNLGLAYRPNVGDNGVHASASPFEALAERMNWLGASASSDHFGKAMLDAGISEATIKDWSVDPQVTYGGSSMPITGSLFDSVEDTDADNCLARCIMINGKGSDSGYVKLGAAFAAGGVVGLMAAMGLSK
eukprot:CAMPEP_0175097666 /NCGR_PEP_ID=MMETSP0086_2-20121207/5409_1 /TAXON_ID=136419 /ORGANISM="Unknown Unknown, Strain D1" /LENGTH=406 /DNA_ID=CAMNT_0016371193 /DNA_START=51 /DNA_END=1271 /DNA_ORIENTATION=+